MSAYNVQVPAGFRHPAIPDRFAAKLKRLTSKEWWSYAFARNDLSDAEWKRLIITQLTGEQWIALHTTCSGRPPWRDTKIHTYNRLNCRGCGATLLWSDAEQKDHPYRYEASIR